MHVVFSVPQQRAVVLFTQFKTAISSYILSWFLSVFVSDIFNDPVAFSSVVFLWHIFHNCFIESMDCRMQCIWIIVIMPIHWDATLPCCPRFFFLIFVTEVCFGLALLDSVRFIWYHSQVGWGSAEGNQSSVKHIWLSLTETCDYISHH